MKKVSSILSVVLFTAWLNAGGNVSPIAKIPEAPCTTNKVYVEKDVNLMWQDQQYTNAEDGAFRRNRSISKAGKFRHAMNYCNALHYAGYNNWRLPTQDELTHVHEQVGQVFSYFRGNDFWSSTPTTENRYNVVFPATAYAYARKQSESNFIRCVRCMDKEEELDAGSRVVR